MSTHIKELKEEVPDYTTMWWRRVVRIKVQELNSEVNPEKIEDVITIAVDSTVNVTNRGEWIRDKWKKRRGFIKIHVAVNIKTKKIVSMEVTKEDVVDGKMLKPLTRQAVLITPSSSCTTISRVVGDGAYDSKDNFRCLDRMGIEPVIRVRKNSSTKASGCMSRKMVVVCQERWWLYVKKDGGCNRTAERHETVEEKAWLWYAMDS
jgi:hypothetical protein